MAPLLIVLGVIVLIALGAVVSYNPALYETLLEGDWYDVERQANQANHRSLLNTYRLKVTTGEAP